MSKKVIAAICAVAVLFLAGVGAFFLLSPGGPYIGFVLEEGTETPLQDVCVSDGRNVVKTDENGRFELKGYRKSRFITVTTPAGYTTEAFYIPVDKKTESYDFRLTKSEETAKTAHSFLQISDTEIGENGVGEWIKYVRRLADELEPAFLIHTGDLCYEAGVKRHLSDMNTENMGLPVRYIIGNHDYVEGKYGEKLFESIYGPIWYSFDVGNVHYVITPFQNGADEKSGYDENDRWRWLENDLANTDPDKKVVMFNHTKSPSEDYTIEFDRKALDLKEHNLIAWVFGHYHYNYVEENDGVLNISTARPDCGGVDQSASGARLVSIDENGDVTTKMYYYDFDGAAEGAPSEPNWVTQLSGNVLFSDAVYDNGRIFVGTVDDDWPRTCGVYALNAADGSILWQYETVNSIKNNVVLQDEKIVTQDCEGNVYCLNAADGALLWHKQVNMNSRALGTSSGVCVDDSVVYTGNSDTVTALNLNTGSVVWENSRGRGENSAAEFVVTGNKLLVSSHWDALAALDKTTGELLWENQDEDIRFRSSTPAVVDENTLLVADDDSIMLVDSNTGEITHKSTIKEENFASSSQPLVSDEIAYIATAEHGVLAYDLNDKQILWRAETKRDLVYTAPYTNGEAQSVEGDILLLGDTLLFAASDGYLYQLNAADGTVLQEKEVGAPVFGSVAAADGTIYLADFSGRVISIHGF